MGNTSRNLPLIVLLIAVAVVALAQQATPATGSANAQASATQTPTTPQSLPQGQQSTAAVLKVQTRLVIVDVVALDRKGAPVRNLEAEDFTMQEEGAMQKISIFNFQQGNQSQGQPTEFVQAPLSPNRVSNMPRFKTNSTLNVLLLDGINVTSTNQKYTREQMLKFLEKLPAGQPLAVYALGSKLRMLQDFTTDPTLLREAVKKAKDNAMGVRAEMTNAADLPPGVLEQMPDDMLIAVLRFGQDLAMHQLDDRVKLTVTQLGALARNLAGFPGRKNLIWLSEAFPDYLVPSNPDPTEDRSVVKGGLQPIMKTYQAEIDHMADLLSNAQVAVYPVDVGTLANRDAYSSLSNTDNNGNLLGRSSRGATRQRTGSQQANEISRATETATNSHATMNSVADQTGGKAFYNTNNLEKAVHESMEDGSTYYTLGYYPQNKDWDGRFRKIIVKVNRPGIKLHYRQGFFAVEPKNYAKLDPKVLAMDMGAALDINNPVSTALPFQAVVVPPSAQNGNKVQINFGVDPHAIGFDLRDDGLEHAAIDCGVRVYTKAGEPLGVQGSTFNAALTAEQYQKVMKMIFPCSQTLQLAPGEYVLRLAVRDNTNGLFGTANGTATVPAVTASQDVKPEEKKP